jgi:hypothetical protein
LFPQAEENSQAFRDWIRDRVSKSFDRAGTMMILIHLINDQQVKNLCKLEAIPLFAFCYR